VVKSFTAKPSSAKLLLLSHAAAALRVVKSFTAKPSSAKLLLLLKLLQPPTHQSIAPATRFHQRQYRLLTDLV
jgi:hypothetical protein